MNKWMMGAAVAALSLAGAQARAETAADAGDATGTSVEELVVTGAKETYASSVVLEPMIERQSALSSVNDVLNELPGVLVTEGDTFGSSDWATSITMRGFVTNRDTQQIGTTIDGLPNGGSGYGGGSRANRYIDVMDLKTVEVSQGTADIGSRSNEALGGTLNYLTNDPEREQRVRVMAAGGDYDARKFYVRVDTGEIAPDTYAWISASSSRNSDWIDGSGKTTRDHAAAKIVSRIAGVDLTGYLSYDDADESEYSSISPEQFAENSGWDRLTGTWTGTPYIDQAYRSGSRALRDNTFAYLRAKFDVAEVKVTLTGYGHMMNGRGDWLPPYLVDVTNNGAGPNTEFLSGTAITGGSALGKIYFVTPTGATATMIAGCTGTNGIPAEYDPSCYASNSLAVQSYRHTHYRNRRYGATADFEWAHVFGEVENTLRGGLWLEHGEANATRDWHRLIDTRIGYAFDDTPYWIQYSTDYETNETLYYLEDVATFGPLTARFGVKQFFIDQSRQGLLDNNTSTSLDSQSDPLISAGLAYDTPVEGLSLFTGFSQNFAAVPRGVLDETDPVALSLVHNETADNVELGARLSRGPLAASLTLYSIKFDNRIVYVPSGFVTGIDYLSEVDGVYQNLGGVESKGFEASASYAFANGLSLSGAYTYNDATYLGSGDAARDAELGIVEGAQVAGSPKHMLVSSLDWRGDIWKAGVSAKYIGERFLDKAGAVEADSVTLTNAYVGVAAEAITPLLKGFDLTLTVNNLTDESYLAGADGSTAFIGAPRTVTISLTADF
ncbi:MAG: TonB-dependent receptor domain-containing protein [Phenylobacterium sp.]|uniref:TonB-dependent receptor domain-containing protein n=1 Tax=Phenylobacterium sp. TaxID=1871053 RepID=UPI00391AFA07